MSKASMNENLSRNELRQVAMILGLPKLQGLRSSAEELIDYIVDTAPEANTAQRSKIQEIDTINFTVIEGVFTPKQQSKKKKKEKEPVVQETVEKVEEQVVEKPAKRKPGRPRKKKPVIPENVTKPVVVVPVQDSPAPEAFAVRMDAVQKVVEQNRNDLSVINLGLHKFTETYRKDTEARFQSLSELNSQVRSINKRLDLIDYAMAFLISDLTKVEVSSMEEFRATLEGDTGDSGN